MTCCPLTKATVDAPRGLVTFLRMNLTEIKQELQLLSPAERRYLAAFLVTLDCMSDATFRRELTAKIDDRDPQHWVSLEEAEDRLLR